MNRGLTSACFILSGNIPSSRDLLKIIANGVEILSLISFSRTLLILSYPLLGLDFKFPIICLISVAVVGVRKGNFVLLVFYQYSDLYHCLMFLLGELRFYQ